MGEFYEVIGKLNCECGILPNNSYWLHYDEEKNVIATCINCYKNYKLITENVMENGKNGIRIRQKTRQHRR